MTYLLLTALTLALILLLYYGVIKVLGIIVDAFDAALWNDDGDPL